jgi:hypothetical protein
MYFCCQSLANLRHYRYIKTMKAVIDLTPEEIDELARSAWGSAASDALSRGLPVTGSLDGRRFRYYPDGRIDDLGPVDPEAKQEIPVGSGVK